MSKHFGMVFSDRTMRRLNALKEMTDARSATEIIRRALMVYESLAVHTQKGVVFLARKPNGEEFEVDFMIDVDKEGDKAS